MSIHCENCDDICGDNIIKNINNKTCYFCCDDCCISYIKYKICAECHNLCSSNYDTYNDFKFCKKSFPTCLQKYTDSFKCDCCNEIRNIDNTNCYKLKINEYDDMSDNINCLVYVCGFCVDVLPITFKQNGVIGNKMSDYMDGWILLDIVNSDIFRNEYKKHIQKMEEQFGCVCAMCKKIEKYHICYECEQVCKKQNNDEIEYELVERFEELKKLDYELYIKIFDVLLHKFEMSI